MTDEPRSPFSSSSWEPRFVIEHYRDEPLRHAIELWRLSNFGFYPDEIIRHVAREPTRLQIAHPGSSASSAPWEQLAPPIAVTDVPALIRSWLDSATYPEQPWFDGGEGRGYCVYWAYWRSEEWGKYRSLVVIPKWIEIHK